MQPILALLGFGTRWKYGSAQSKITWIEVAMPATVFKPHRPDRIRPAGHMVSLLAVPTREPVDDKPWSEPKQA